MTDLIARISAPIAGAAASLAGGVAPDVALERPGDASHGDFATTVALRLAPVLRRSPRQIAEEIASRIRDGRDYAAVEVAGAGFVNIRLAPAWYHDAVAEIAAAGDDYGAGRPDVRRNVLVELVSANPTGEVTVASARNGAYGDSVARLLEFAGHEVVREYYFNDAGGQVERFGASVRAERRGDPMPEDGYPGAVVAELAATLPLDPDASVEEWTAAAVPPMFERIKASLERLRIHVDIWFSERDLHASGAVERAIGKARAAGHVYERDGATWLATTQFGDDKDRVLMKSDGVPTYFAADLAYIEHKFSRGHDRLIYILGADHHGYVARLKAGAACMGYDPRRSRCRSTRWSPFRASGWGSGAATWSPPTSWSRRSASTRRGSSSCSARTTRRWTSISTSPCGRSARTPSTTSSTRMPAQSILRRAAGEGHERPPARGRTPGAAGAGAGEAPGRVARRGPRGGERARAAPRDRLRPVAGGDFHVFHHDLRVLARRPRRAGAFRLTLTAAVGRRCDARSTWSAPRLPTRCDRRDPGRPGARRLDAAAGADRVGYRHAEREPARGRRSGCECRRLGGGLRRARRGC